MKIISEIRAFLDRRKARKWLKAGEKNYKNRHKQYTREATSEEVSRLRVDEISTLRNEFSKIHTKFLSGSVFFEDVAPFKPYVILDGVRYNLEDEVVLPSRPNHITLYMDEIDLLKRELPIRKTLAECILPQGMVLLRSFQQVIEDADKQMLVTIKPYQRFYGYSRGRSKFA